MKFGVPLFILVASVSSAPRGLSGLMADGIQLIENPTTSNLLFKSNRFNENASSISLHRPRRGIMDWVKKYIYSPKKSGNVQTTSATEHTTEISTTNHQRSEKTLLTNAETETREVLSYHRDTDVNYLRVQPHHNPDAEVVDMNLIDDEANKFHTRRSQSIGGYPVLSQSFRSKAVMSQPIESEPNSSRRTLLKDTDVNYIGAQPGHNPDAEVFDVNLVGKNAEMYHARRPQYIKFQSVMSHPVRSHLQMSQAAGAQRSLRGDMDVNYTRGQPRNDPDAEVFDPKLVKSDAYRFHARQSQPMRMQPLLSKFVKSQVVMTKNL